MSRRGGDGAGVGDSAGEEVWGEGELFGGGLEGEHCGGVMVR